MIVLVYKSCSYLNILATKCLLIEPPISTYLTSLIPVVTVYTARFNNEKLDILFTDFIDVFDMTVITNSDYFSIQH